MPNSPESSDESVSNSSSARNQIVDSAAQAAASDSPGTIQVDDSQPPDRSFSQTRRAVGTLFRALRQALQARTALTKINAPSSWRSTRSRITSVPHEWVTTALV